MLVFWCIFAAIILVVVLGCLKVARNTEMMETLNSKRSETDGTEDR